MHYDITGIILAGGKSKRMGTNKALLKLGDKYAIEIISELMKGVFEKVILITNDPDEYSFLNLPMCCDIHKNIGPLAGIHSGLFHSKTENNFLISCDTPLLTSDIIEYIINYKTEKPITVCYADSHIQKLTGIYKKTCITHAEEIIRNIEDIKNKCAVKELLECCGAEIIEIENKKIYSGNEFYNMNKPEDYETIKSIYSNISAG